MPTNDAARHQPMDLSAVPAHDAPPPPDEGDPVVEFYKKDVDRSLLRENLKLTVDERCQKFQSYMRYVGVLQEAGRRARSAD